MSIVTPHDHMASAISCAAPSPLHPPLHSYFVGTFLKRAPLPRIWGNEASPHCTKNTHVSLARVQQECFCACRSLHSECSHALAVSLEVLVDPLQHHHQHGTLATYRSIVRTQYAFQSGCHSSPSRSTRTSPSRRRAELAASPRDSLDCLVLSLLFDVQREQIGRQTVLSMAHRRLVQYTS
jgi:hypothetical protein